MFSNQGLLRFDGQSWQTFSSIGGEPTDIIGIGLSEMAIDLKGNLWLSLGNQGIGCYDGQSWRVFTTADGLASNSVEVVFADSHDNIWCSTDQGVSSYDGTGWQNFDNKEVGFDGMILSISEDNQGNLWFGINDTVTHSLHRYDGKTWQMFTAAGLTDPQFLAVDHEGNLWCVNSG